jgi:hypothetical protein
MPSMHKTYDSILMHILEPLCYLNKQSLCQNLEQEKISKEKDKENKGPLTMHHHQLDQLF